MTLSIIWSAMPDNTFLLVFILFLIIYSTTFTNNFTSLSISRREKNQWFVTKRKIQKDFEFLGSLLLHFLQPVQSVAGSCTNHFKCYEKQLRFGSKHFTWLSRIYSCQCTSQNQAANCNCKSACPCGTGCKCSSQKTGNCGCGSICKCGSSQ
ncbi:uncharacterized protein LOC111676151 isoform X1 [Lucilia cuprina]|uniref:uncharacterized protein LOC111676151 isoform X1 n=1 Tax=Lucilia cuprina TaxID=7375 RepID=UPI001F067C82|nr:uncharacterized protein LOC111676151 isoform X1 [Lucilia cuprina]